MLIYQFSRLEMCNDVVGVFWWGKQFFYQPPKVSNYATKIIPETCKKLIGGKKLNNNNNHKKHQYF